MSQWGIRILEVLRTAALSNICLLTYLLILVICTRSLGWLLAVCQSLILQESPVSDKLFQLLFIKYMSQKFLLHLMASISAIFGLFPIKISRCSHTPSMLFPASSCRAENGVRGIVERQCLLRARKERTSWNAIIVHVLKGAQHRDADSLVRFLTSLLFLQQRISQFQ